MIVPPRSADEDPSHYPTFGLGCNAIRVCRGVTCLVYLCTRPGWEPDEVAVKMLHGHLSQIPSTRDKFILECYLWLKIPPHPNLANVLSVHYASPNPPLLMMQYVPQSLRDIMASGTLSVVQTIRIALDALEGLAHARRHLKDFVHGDLKPENLLIADDQTCMITDLGLSHVALPETHNDYSHLAGTPLYMAPEQALGGPSTSQSDVYSLGCIMYEMLAGEPVYGIPIGEADYLLRHVHGSARPITDIRSEVPREFSKVITDCLAKDPNARPSLQQLARDLQEIAANININFVEAPSIPPNAERLYAAGQGLSALGFFSEAIELLAESINADPFPTIEACAHMLIARCHMLGESDFDAAETELRAAGLILASAKESNITDDLVDGPCGALLHTERGRLLEGRGDQAGAFAEFEAAARVGNNSASWANLAISYHNRGSLDEAIDAMKEAVDISAELRYLQPLVEWLLVRRRFAEALEYGSGAVFYYGDDALARALRAVAVACWITVGKGELDDTMALELLEDIELAFEGGAPAHLTDGLAGLSAQLREMYQLHEGQKVQEEFGAESDDQRQHALVATMMATWEPIISAMVAARDGNMDAAQELSRELAEWEEIASTSSLARALRGIYDGERGLENLSSLNEVDFRIATRCLNVLSGREATPTELWKAMKYGLIIGYVVTALHSHSFSTQERLRIEATARTALLALRKDPDWAGLARLLGLLLDRKATARAAKRVTEQVHRDVFVTVVKYGRAFRNSE